MLQGCERHRCFPVWRREAGCSKLATLQKGIPMNALIADQSSPRIASLNPFDIGAGAPLSCRARPKTTECRASSRTIQTQALEKVEELGCVDWYLYPAVRAPRRA